MRTAVKNKSKKPVQRAVYFEMVCKSCPKEIICIEKFLREVNRKLHFDDGTMYRLLVSCTEAVNNAIVHGNHSDRKKKVVISCSLNRRIIKVCVKDEGKGFDPDKLTDPREEMNLLKESGRGVFLMRAMMDKVTFRKLKSGLTVEMQLKLK